MSQDKISTMRISLSRDSLTADQPLRSDYGKSAPLLVAPAAPGKYRHIAGRIPDSEPFPARLIEDPLTIEAIDAFSASTGPVTLGQKMRLASLLFAHLKAPAIAALLNHRDPAEVWRWAALGQASPALRDAVLSERLTITHARPLLALPHQDQEAWVNRAVRGRWSVRRLTMAIKRESAGQPPPVESADIQALQNTLGERLGTSVQVCWPEDPAGARAFVIDWYDVESLKGILAQLAAGPDMNAPPSQSVRRQLVIPLQNADELEALTGHLAVT